jgi:hypothetical protein
LRKPLPAITGYMKTQAPHGKIIKKTNAIAPELHLPGLHQKHF